MHATFSTTDQHIYVRVKISKRSLVLSTLSSPQLSLIRDASQPDTKLSDKLFALYILSLALEKDHELSILQLPGAHDTTKQDSPL